MTGGAVLMTKTTLQEWCASYTLRRGLGGQSAYVFRHTIDVYDAWLGRASVLADLDEDRVSEWIAWSEAVYAPRTRAGLRGNLLCLWRYIAEETKEIAFPGRVRRAPVPEPQPVAWTLEELRKIRIACVDAPGVICRCQISRSLYLTTLLDAAYETGLRRGDLWRLEQNQFSPNGIIVLRQHKTQRPHEPQVQEDTLRRIRSLPGKYPLRWPGSEKGFYKCWKNHVIVPSGVRHGVLQQIRRTGATQIESIRPQDTSRYLGHRTPTMKRNYVDRSQAYGPAPQPPKFWW